MLPTSANQPNELPDGLPSELPQPPIDIQSMRDQIIEAAKQLKQAADQLGIDLSPIFKAPVKKNQDKNP
jgi:outer membrane protein TolC